MKEAVSVVLQCGNDIFMVRRQNYLKAFPGYHSFPGGKIDEGDEKNSFKWDNWQWCKRALGACRRELQEEINFDLAEAFAEGQILNCQHLGAAHTPSFNPHRYKSDFYLITLNQKIDFDLDPNEACWGGWKKAEDFYNDYLQGKLLGVPPTIKLINKLATGEKKYPWDIDFHYDELTEVPCIQSIYGVTQLIPLSNTLPPASRTNCFYLGDEQAKKVLVDPSPRNQEECKKLIHSIGARSIDEIFLTHHHIDHRENADLLAKHWNAALSMSALTKEFIQSTDSNFLKDREVKVYKEGDVLTSWLGKEISILEVPGHDNGQLALMPTCGSWCIVGDLIQGIGTVVVSSKPYGSMSKYFNSLEKIISLKPEVIYPSHGIAMGGVFRLEKTYEHRLKREEKVAELLDKGFSEQQMLEQIYPGLDERLKPYALINIIGHIEKLQEVN